MAKTVTIKAESGISFEFHKTWYKLNYAEERQIGDNDNKEEEIKKLWEDVNNIVDEQMEEIINSDN